MAVDRSYIAANTRERERLRALVEGLDDEAITAPVKRMLDCRRVLGHIAYWDIRVLVSPRRSIVGSHGRRETPSPRATGQRHDPSADPRDRTAGAAERPNRPPSSATRSWRSCIGPNVAP